MLAQTQILKRDNNKLRAEYELTERVGTKLTQQCQQLKTLRNMGVIALETIFPSISKRLRTLQYIFRHKRTPSHTFGRVHPFTHRPRYYNLKTYIVLELISK